MMDVLILIDDAEGGRWYKTFEGSPIHIEALKVIGIIEEKELIASIEFISDNAEEISLFLPTKPIKGPFSEVICLPLVT